MLTHVTRNEEQWDTFVLEHGGGFLQSWGWSQFQEALGRTVYRFRLDRPGDKPGEPGHEDTVGQFMLVGNALPFGKQYAYVPRGPVVDLDGGSDAGRIHLETCVAALRETVARSGAVFARVEWPYSTAASPVSPDDLRRWGFEKVRSVQPADTSIVDLRPAEIDILAAMRQKARYNIRVAQKHGVIVREARHDHAHLFRHDMDLFWRILGETAARDIFHTHPQRYYATMLDVLSPRQRTGYLNVRLHFAEYRGEAVAAAIVAEFGDTVTYLHGGSIGAFRSVMAPYQLHWAIMQQAKRRGFRRYDLWGVAPPDAAHDHPWHGITRFKDGFGGERVHYLGAWELPGNRFWYTLYRHAKRFRNL